MEAINDLCRKIPLITYMVGTAYWVEVTHVEDPHNFFVRPYIFKKYIKFLERVGSALAESEADVGTMVVFKSKKKSDYVRGRIICILRGEKTTYDIFALDNGYVEKSVRLKRIFKPYYDVSVPSLASNCQLLDCQPIDREWSKKGIMAMVSFVHYKSQKVKMIIKNNNNPMSMTVELINPRVGNIGKLLLSAGHASIGYGNSFFDKFYENASN